MPSPHTRFSPAAEAARRPALLALAALATFGAQSTPAAARAHPQSGLLALAPFGAVEALGQITHYHLAPRPGQHAAATVAVARLAPRIVTQFAPPPPGMVNGVALGGMVLPARLVDPVVSYQPHRRGPIVELGVAGGGMPTQAGLAHVGMHWQF